MKNLFKNLMLVAVAAMAFTACTETNDEVNANVEKRVFKFVAGFDEETRSGFDGKNDAGTGYKSAWDGNEKLKVCANGEFASAQLVDLKDAQGHFEVVFEGTIPTLIDVYSPASAWNSEHYPTVPAVQTPRANSVDPAAHMLMAQAVPVESGVVTMSHKFAYGKMTVNTPAEFTISKVELSLVGLPYGWTEDQTYSYTINATNVVNNTFWFTTEALNHVKEFTVTAYNADGDKYAKTVTGLDEGKLAFNVGAVSTFSVSDLQAVVVEPEPEPDTVMDSAKYYFDYNDYGAYEDWGYVVFEDEFLGTLVLNCTFASGLYLDVCEYTYTANSLGVRFDDALSFYNLPGATPFELADYWVYSNKMTVDVVDGKYSISLDFQNANGENLAATYVGDIEGLGYPDLRTQLEKPSVTATANGKTITLSWNAVEGADGYRVNLYSPYDEHFEEIVTTNEYVYEAQLYNTKYSFTIMSCASDTSAQYRSSEDAYADVTTGKDPNAFADNIATDLYFNGDGDLVFVVDAYETFKVKLNSADRPNNTTIKEGEYTAVASSTVPAGNFSVYQKIKGGYNEGWSSTKTTSTMTVEYVDGQYLIIVDYISAWEGSGEVGYKGVPEGWDQPVADTTPVIKLDTTSVELMRAGSSVDVNVTLKNITESIVAVSDNAQFTTSVNGNVVTISAPENNTGADINGIVTISAGGVSAQVTVKQVAEDVVTEVTWSYVVDSSNSGTFGHMWNVSGNDLDGYPVSAQITMDSRNGYTSSSHFTAGTYNYHGLYADGNYSGGMWFTMRNINFRGNQYSNSDVTGTITVEIEGGRTKITADIYNLVNGYQTSKITTFVGYLN